MTNQTTRSTYPGAGGIPVGATVVTRDGHELGHVKELQGAHFKVDASMKRDYWLSTDIIGDYRDRSIVVIFDEAELDSYRLSEPEGRVADPITDEQLNTFSSGEEKAGRREEMIEGYGHVSDENRRLATDPYRRPPTDSDVRGVHQHVENIHGTISIGADVYAGDDTVGTVARVVVDPDTNEMHSIVVKSGTLLSHERAVPLTCVSGGDGEALHLDMDKDSFESCSLFDPGAYHQPDPDYVGPPGFDNPGMGNNFTLNSFVAMGPLMAFGPPTPPLGYPGGEVRSGPSERSELSIGEGSEVFDCNGEKVGEVDRLELDPGTGEPTRLVVRHGFIFHKDTEVPRDVIADIGDDMIVLSVAASSLHHDD